MAQVRLENLGKTFGALTVVHGVNLTIGDGEFVVLLGPSGCGKSTTLRMIAGLEAITEGELTINGKPMNDVDPKNRGVAMVFQNYALYPHKTVFDNMAMALKLSHVAKPEIHRRVSEVAEMLGLTPYLDRKPAALSGGQRQRVAIGRAIVRTPQVFLFDEPLSNLDAKLRVKMRMELQHLHRRLGVTSIYVTHDQVEAMTMADRIVIMDSGEVAQVGTPREVYDRPANFFVAGFIGSPAMNFLTLRRAADGWQAEGAELRLPALPFDTGALDTLTLGIRPEHVEVSDHPLGPGCFNAEVELAELLGADALLNLSVAGVEMLARVGGTAHPERGDSLCVKLPPKLLHAFDPATGKALSRKA